MDATTKKRVEAFLAGGNISAVEDIVTTALREAPSDADALVLRARLTAFKGEFKAATVVLKRALNLEPRHLDGRALKGAILVETGRLDEGQRVLEEVVKEPNTPAAANFNLARCYRAAGKLEPARRHLGIAIRKEPDNGVMAFALAESYVETGEFEHAVELLEAALHKDPGFADSWLTLARIQISQDHAGDAIRNLEEGLKHSPDNSELTELLASTLLLVGDFQKATAQFRVLAEQFPEDPSVLSNLGLCFAASERYAESEEAYWAALALEPNDVHLLTQLAVLLEMKDGSEPVQEAVSLLKKATKAPDAGWEPFNDLGRLLTTRHEVLNLERGAGLLEQAQSQADGAAEVEVNLAIAYAAMEHVPKMREACEAVKRNPAATTEMKAQVIKLLREVR